MSARRLRVKISGLSHMAIEAIRSGTWHLVEDAGSCDVHLVARQPAGDGHRSGVPTGRALVAGPDPGLTQRELEVLEWLGRGASNAAIADELFISENTVKNHVRSILGKLECASRTEAVIAAHQRGLLVL